jgi:hypothetical protein
MDKPVSPSFGKSTLEMSKPPSPEDMEDPASAKGVPTSPSNASLGCDPAHQSPGPEPTEHPKASPHSPMSFGLRAPSGRQTGEGSSVPRSEKQLHQ